MLVLTYTATLEFFERFALADARALGALVTVISDATMVHPDPVVVRRAGTHYLDARAMCPRGAFHPKLLVIAGDGQARVAIGSGNLTMAGWHANAELWTVLRGDEDGGPTTLRQVSAFLRALASSEVRLSPGAAAALERTAEQLDGLPAEDPGPALLHSLQEPIADQLPPGDAVDELVVYAPFHDSALTGTRALLDRLQPAEWTAYVQPDTEVNGEALAGLAAQRGGRVAWVSRELEQDDGRLVADDRYWHGKLVQWRRGEARWTLSGSPNLSRPALLSTTADGNCELALLSDTSGDLTPAEGAAPPGGLETLVRSAADDSAETGLVLLSAVVHEGAVALQIHTPLTGGAVLQRYDIGEDRWRRSATLRAGSDTYEIDLAAAPIGHAVRILRDDNATSNSVFVADPERLRRRQERPIGKVRTTAAEVARLGLGQNLLADLDELRGHLLRAGATVASSRPASADDASNAGAEVPAARPAPGISLEDFLAACDPVLGQRMTEFALVLPALPGVGAALDDAQGTLDTDDDADDGDPAPSEREDTLGEALRRAPASERERYRQFLERLLARARGYPTVVRNIAAHSALHAMASGIWSEERWPSALAEAIAALGGGGDEPNEHERAAAASLAAVALAVLRLDVGKLSRRDEHMLRYEAAGQAVAALLPHVRRDRIELVTSELLKSDPPRRVAGVASSTAVDRAIAEVLHRPQGASRAARLLAEDHGVAATVTDGEIVDLRDPLDPVAEPLLLLTLALTEEDGPVYVRARTSQDRPVLGAWCKPWLTIEREGPAGRWGRAWRLGSTQTPAMLRWDDLPRAACAWAAGQTRPDEVADLLALIESSD